MGLDLVYLVGPQSDDAELRYSLRSADRNLPHDAVWFVGRRLPRWATGVEFVRIDEGPRKWENLPRAILAAASVPQIGGAFYLMNDDFFVMMPHGNGVPMMHRGPIEPRASAGRYWKGFAETTKVLRALGCAGELNYEVHAPMPVSKDALRYALEEGLALHRGGCLHSRTLYGNLTDARGEPVYEDPKVAGPQAVRADARLLSTNAQSWAGRTGDIIRARFPDPSKYEKE